MQQSTTSVSIVDRAYLAGLFDGEGCVSIYHCKETVRRGFRRSVYYTHVTIGMSDLPGPLLAHSLYGGALLERPPRGATKRLMHVWQGSNDVAVRFLTDVLPYLRIKGPQAQVFLEFRRTFDGHNRKGRGAVVPAEVIDLRDRLLENCKALKRA